MNICEDRIRKSLVNLNVAVKSSEISKLLKEKVNFDFERTWHENNFIPWQELNSQHVDEMIAVLCRLLKENPQVAHQIRVNFGSLLLPLVSEFLEDDSSGDFLVFQRKCIALSILAETNQQVLR